MRANKQKSRPLGSHGKNRLRNRAAAADHRFMQSYYAYGTAKSGSTTDGNGKQQSETKTTIKRHVAEPRRDKDS